MKILNKRYVFAMSTIILVSFLIIFFQLNKEKRNRVPKSATLVQLDKGSDYYS